MGNSNSCMAPPLHLTTADAVTSSVCVTTADTGVHNFTVASYSRLKGMGVGKCVSSKPFSVGGYNWQIMFYPDGYDQAHAGYAGAFLYCCGACDGSAATGMRTEFTLSLRVKDGKVHKHCMAYKRRLTLTFESVDVGWGFPTFVKRSKLREECFTIRCDLIVIKNDVR